MSQGVRIGIVAPIFGKRCILKSANFCSLKMARFGFHARRFHLRNADIAMYKIAIKEKEKALIKFRDKFKVSCPILIDERGQVSNTFHVRSHPETYSINRKGKIGGRAFGGRDWTSLNMRNFIQYLLREGSPTP